jgi:hypothetical protein
LSPISNYCIVKLSKGSNMAALVPSMNRKRGAPFNVIQIINDAPPSSLMDSIASPKVKTMEGKELGVLFSSQHFGGRRVC